MGRGKEHRVELPEKWWRRLNSICNSKWRHRGTRLDIYQFTKISKTAFDSAKRTCAMTERLFARLTEAVGYETQEDLLRDLGSTKETPRLATPVPTSLSLSTQRSNPQWADYRDYEVEAPRPWVLRCQITTESPYFRFGFKLLGENGRIFGDGSIKSHDANLIVHIGRNNWDRSALRITAQDIFLTAYMSGNFIEENDKFLFRSAPKLVVPIELIVDRGYFANLTVNRQKVFRHVMPPEICRRVVLYAWGDREEFFVDVTDLTIRGI